MSSATFNVLVLCTGNSARSILAESLLNHWGRPEVLAASGGSQPTGKVHPLALRALHAANVPSAGARSKSWEEFSATGAPAMDLVITVCDRAAGEACPLWPGNPLRLHWGLPDPAAAKGTEVEQLQAFQQVLQRLQPRVQGLVTAVRNGQRGPTLLAALQQLHLDAD